MSKCQAKLESPSFLIVPSFRIQESEFILLTLSDTSFHNLKIRTFFIFVRIVFVFREEKKKEKKRNLNAQFSNKDATGRVIPNGTKNTTKYFTQA
jgi:hypothetical protein